MGANYMEVYYWIGEKAILEKTEDTKTLITFDFVKKIQL